MTVQTNTSNTSIRPVLYGNAVFSGFSGLYFAAASKSVATFLGIEASFIVLELGLSLMLFAGLLFYYGSRPSIPQKFVLFAIIADSIWVLASVLLLVTNWVPFSVEGKWAVGIIAIIVDIFAGLQFFQWRKMR